MTEAGYILCLWRRRWWPAKVSLAGRTSRRQLGAKSKPRTLWVEILGLNKQARVRLADVKPLEEESINSIACQLRPASSRDHSKKSRKPIEELTYRCALRQALDILSRDAATPKAEAPLSKKGKGEASSRKATPTRALPPRPASSQRLRSQRDPQEAPSGESTAESPTPVVERRLGSRASLVSSPRASKLQRLSGPEEGAGQCRSPQKLPRKSTVTPQKEQEPSPRSGEDERRPRASKERDERRRPSRGKPGEESVFPPPTRMSTPVAASRKCRPMFVKSRVQRNLLSSPAKGLSAELARVLPEEGETPPRKYSRSRNGSRRPEGPRRAQPIRTCAADRGKNCPGNVNFGSSPDESLSEGKVAEKHDVDINGKQFQLQDFEDAGGFEPASSLRLSPIGQYSLSAASRVDEDEDEELPSILQYPEPSSIKAGVLVWCRMPRQPFWPAVVKRVQRKARKANVILIDDTLGKKSKGFSTSFRNLKHYECKEKEKLIAKAKETHSHDIDWCINLITDYLVRVGCESFTGSFLEYCAHEMSYSVRRDVPHDLPQETTPELEEPDTSEPLPEASPSKPLRKVLPDRTRAARDKANERLVKFIVKSKGADEHLRSILRSKKPSRWLSEFFVARPYLTCMETYLEDDRQQDLVLNYLREVYQEAEPEVLPEVNGDSIKFILDVLFPEAIIYAISAVDHIDYKKAEEIYLRGPLVSQREREIFEEEILEKRRRKHELQSRRRPPEASQ